MIFSVIILAIATVILWTMVVVNSLGRERRMVSDAIVVLLDSETLLDNINDFLSGWDGKQFHGNVPIYQSDRGQGRCSDINHAELIALYITARDTYKETRLLHANLKETIHDTLDLHHIECADILLKEVGNSLEVLKPRLHSTTLKNLLGK